MLPLLLVLACTDKGEDTSGDIVPAEGTWTLSNTTVTDDSCDAQDSVDPPPPSYTLALEAPDTGDAGLPFTLTPDEGEALDCMLASSAFTCDPVTDKESGSDGTGSYTVTYSWTTSGTFTSETAGAGALDMLIECTDTNDAFCPGIEAQNEITFPCTMKTTFELSAG